MRNTLFMMSLVMLASMGMASTPAPDSRILRTIDFEERKLGNREDLPMYWSKATGPGLPHYVHGVLAQDRTHAGQYSFRLDLDGGSVIYRYDQNPVKVQLGAHYRIDGFVHTTPLLYARSRVSAYFTDADLHELPGTLKQTPLYASTDDKEPFEHFELDLSAVDPAAAFLVIEVGLLQPEQFSRSSLGERTLFMQDIHGQAWFDDIVISQVPQVTLSTDRPGNIFPMGEKPVLKVLVNDRNTDDLSATIVLSDADGKVIYRQSGAMDMRGAESLNSMQRRLSVTLPSLAPGWYRAGLQMISQGQFLGEQSMAFVVLADDATPVRPDPRFGLIATDLPFAGWGELPHILPYLSAGRVKLAVWSKEGDIQQIAPAQFDRLLENLQELGITPTACLLALPPEIARKTHGQGWTSLLQTPREAWNGQLATLVSRHANHLDRWQLEADGSEAFVTSKQMRQVYKVIYHEFAQLVQQPDLAMPWPAWYELDGELPATIALSVPPSVLPSQLPLYMDDLKNREGKHLSLTLQSLDAKQYGRQQSLRDFAQRLIYALSAGADRIDIPLPFTMRQENGQTLAEPQEVLLVARTILQTLGGATFNGRAPIDESVEAFLFERDGHGILVMWDRSSENQDREIALNLLPGAYSMDLWGNRSLLASKTSPDNSTSNLRIAVGTLPVFVCGIDAQMAELRASVALDRPLLESSFQPHTRKLRFVNPYRTAIAGSIKLKAPAGWTINPPTFSYSLNPGESFEREMTIEFPYNSFAGAKTITAEVNVQGERNSSFMVPINLNLGLSDVGIQTLALRDGKDIVVQQVITNYGDKPIDYTAFAMFPGQARQERLISGLAPGRSTIKRYRFNDVSITRDSTVRSGVKELNGTRILNEQVSIQ